ncbi:MULTISPECIES: ATP-binding protein [Streptomyces]|uniref:ATP-binding protein n=1 Tax=Streptomyces venezuelae TaxID=54571 RepID=A0A5P2BAB6_STRVZ|nr:MULTISPECIES: ATP-binding protein [Streptomyces]NEA05486.1 ATP-binding protein [Streptomyces sp. SID10116]MYY81103.1 ATP-binding protein [Streptomyces sp. SID335]MYZ12861.1 ATP-binding protein [Streptomyces sp. SID337]NDZ92431.1 ATP-binding protein [Streptomyces sp. SID10115]NEB48377.1 ATP-binding protein [Streptomyces sp. SID339]
MPRYEEGAHRLRRVLPFEATPKEVPLLRLEVKRNLEQWGALSVLDEAGLVATELATNVIKHVGEGTPATLVLEPRGGRLRVEVHDGSSAVPTLSAVCGEAECGRGLHLLASLSEEWGTVVTAAGKVVWCEISLTAVGQCARVQRAAAVLDEYCKLIGSDSMVAPERALLETLVPEVIADLLHWLAAQGGDPDEALGLALARYESAAAEAA